MSRDPESKKIIESKVGKYDWLLGDAGNKQRDVLMTFIDIPSLTSLVRFNGQALGLESFVKTELLIK